MPEQMTVQLIGGPLDGEMVSVDPARDCYSSSGHLDTPIFSYSQVAPIGYVSSYAHIYRRQSSTTFLYVGTEP